MKNLLFALVTAVFALGCAALTVAITTAPATAAVEDQERELDLDGRIFDQLDVVKSRTVPPTARG